MAAIFEPLLAQLKLTIPPVSAFEPVAQPKLRLRPFVKFIKSESMDSSKMFQEPVTNVSSLSLRLGEEI